MTEENLNTTGTTTDAAAAVDMATTAPDEDSALGALWDQMERDNGAERGADGKFKKTEGAAGDTAATTSDNPPLEGEGEGEAQTTADTSATQAVPLPTNLRGMDAEWAKVPPDVQAKIAEREAEVHRRLSDQGRQIGEFTPYVEVFDRNKDLLSGKRMPDGSAPSMLQGVDFLFNAQRRLDQNPIAGLIEIADRYGVRQHLAAALTGQMKIPEDPQGSSLTATDVERIIKETMTQTAASTSANEEISRLSKDKPLYSEIAEDDMVHAIHKARTKLGDTASREAVFDLAYDIAVNADPDLRAKAAAAAKTAATATNPKRTADAKRANAVNVTSTSTGRTRELTEDELLSQAYDEAQNKG